MPPVISRRAMRTTAHRTCAPRHAISVDATWWTHTRRLTGCDARYNVPSRSLDRFWHALPRRRGLELFDMRHSGDRHPPRIVLAVLVLVENRARQRAFDRLGLFGVRPVAAQEDLPGGVERLLQEVAFLRRERGRHRGLLILARPD